MALYRKYRPGSFAEVVGQEQVTRPLSVALDSGRINHAYLFSGPRGCGKTSSARILARSLNCEQGPTSTPCGVCNSCVSLAPNGPGNLDVTELDAASNNGVEDMRELRDRAVYAPAESRYRIFIIDEAHMITTSGANALLKIVEEPPEHLIFIFATTEPEKVIGTIRSRTHHYPFRLLTPQAMRGLIERTVAGEGAQVEDSVFPLVIRAGGGSPRDTLSVLDQLLAGSGPEGLTYEHARMLLGATDETLLDAATEALSSGDHAGLFTTVDKVIEAGLDPRRFASDLLDRFRDLMVLQAVPDAFTLGLVDAPTDRADILRAQAEAFAPGETARLAAIVNDGLSDLRGATSPRLLLEILCAKMLLPTTGVVGVGAVGVAGAAGAGAAGVGSGTVGGMDPAKAQAAAKYDRAAMRKAREEAQQAKAQDAEAPKVEARAPEPQPVPAPQPQPQPQPETAPQPERAPAPQPQADLAPEPKSVPAPEPAPAPAPAAAPAPEQAPTSQPADLDKDIRAKWADVRATAFKLNSVTGIMLTEAKVIGFREDTLVIGHNTGALAQRLNDPANNEVIVRAIEQELGAKMQVECVVGTNPEQVEGVKATAPQKVWNPEPKPEPEPTPAPTPTPVTEQRAEGQGPGDVGNADDSWGEPASLGKDEVPLPPEPPEFEAPPEPYGYAADEGMPQPTPVRTGGRVDLGAAREQFRKRQAEAEAAPQEAAQDDREAQEQEMAEQAATELGERDARDALTVAMDLVTEELGARRI
ncbi:DNA polymerase III subunit gamma and tau [Corynebacterium sp. 153RC1]|uniref:DNA polymerase III subunit gamma and tau n=1 Tax=unclassified Corynebacterium TaxID=2624378 RepID=UPI00211BF337|nr:DNA polymerase III subunit gamma and tau [Corynebacterium sp. 209RC1]MCQ9355100.1 DNA polymerase III subunit gamma and tau [Corynebacterium sp. 1222RC1]MCQ9357462.1 DNA polymerase III subunit gamma and tau [Corynebacterium sp. 122RC1]MCQ9359841.1 DNA polymerase III subunit gamma and tau [Corynebacterium sp. 142RC1]MCQ9362057.1 DNA polymerase III subunit gamma and tau [Corynebacterium sp. 153RC1]MCQ9363320.1 DNA polymerase III subunit gamma and tau [Corynebacterium sp. 732RC1]MCQ9366318.1 D